MLIHGVDFTSAPGRRKGITIASGTLSGRRLAVTSIQTLEEWTQFELWLHAPGPWIGGFDFPFGLPREAVADLGWPQDWEALAAHCAGLGRVRLRAALDAYRATRPVGNKYPHRRGDLAAGSHSPVKLVNPPVALMYLEGAPRLAASGVHLPGLRPGDLERIALEAYPGYAVRQLCREMRGGARPGSYKNDAKSKQTPERRKLRGRIVRQLAGKGLGGIRLDAGRALLASLVDDGSGDRLDAVLCALQAAHCWRLRAQNFGLPEDLDPLEGWIATVTSPLSQSPRP